MDRAPYRPLPSVTRTVASIAEAKELFLAGKLQNQDVVRVQGTVRVRGLGGNSPPSMLAISSKTGVRRMCPGVSARNPYAALESVEQARIEQGRIAAETELAEQARVEQERLAAEAELAEQARVEQEWLAAEAELVEQARVEQEWHAAEAELVEQAFWAEVVLAEQARVEQEWYAAAEQERDAANMKLAEQANYELVEAAAGLAYPPSTGLLGGGSDGASSDEQEPCCLDS